LRVLDAHPEGLPAAAAVTAVAQAIGLEPELERARVPLPGGGEVEAFARDVRWTRQQALQAGQVDGSIRNLWKLTPRGRHDLRNALPGIVITVITTALGRALWAEAESAFASVDAGSVSLWLTSPPYPLQREKEYGNARGDEYLDWLTAICREFHRTLRSDGSLWLNLGDCWEPGRPVMSLYQEKLLLRLCEDLGFRFAQRFIWHNPSRLPGPAEWVTIRRCRVTTATEQLYWLSKSDEPKADNSRVLRAYSESMRRRQQQGGERASSRPSGHQLAAGAFAQDRGGSIPQNLLTVANTASNSEYLRYCHDHSLPVHPARFPQQIAETPILMCTDPGDLVGDAFAGSCTTAAVAERLGRRWIAIERSMTYLQGAVARFPNATTPDSL
jgi:site-specific DNA-methyltransferase (cytosine-N4-specific)